MEKIKTFGRSLLPLLLWIGAQLLVTLLYVPGVRGVGGLLEALGMDREGFLRFVSRESIYLISIGMDALTLLFGIWWLKSMERREGKERGKLSPWLLVKLALLGLGIQVGTDLVLMGISSLFPELMQGYGQVMESLGMYDPSLCSVAYTVLLAPLAEELVFRGLTLRILTRSFSFWQANLLQALYFALAHGNLIQGSYAFLAGLLFGFLAKRCQTLKAPVFCHFAVNLCGILLGFLPIGG